MVDGRKWMVIAHWAQVKFCSYFGAIRRFTSNSAISGELGEGFFSTIQCTKCSILQCMKQSCKKSMTLIPVDLSRNFP